MLSYSSEANIFLKLSKPTFSAGVRPADSYIVSISLSKSFCSMEVSDKSSKDLEKSHMTYTSTMSIQAAITLIKIIPDQ